MAKKETKPVEQPPSEEVEQVEEASGGEQEYLVKTPSFSPAVSAEYDSVAKSKKKKKKKKNKKKKAQSSSAAASSPKTKKNKKRPIDEEISRDVKAKLVKTEEKQTKKKPVPSEEGEEVSMEDDEEEEEEEKNVVLVNGEDKWFEKSFLFREICSSGLGEETVKQVWSLVPAESKKMFQEMLKELEIDEIRRAVRKMDIVHNVSSALAEVAV